MGESPILGGFMCDLDKDDPRAVDYDRVSEVRHGFLWMWFSDVQKELVKIGKRCVFLALHLWKRQKS